MAYSASKGLIIKGITTVIPQSQEDNLLLDDLNKSQREALVRHTGIRYRYRLSQKNASIKYAFQFAIERLIEKAKWDKNSIDLLIVVSQTTLGQIPSLACQLHGELKLNSQLIAYDINSGCSGYVYGLHTISQLLQNFDKKNPRAIFCCGDFSSQLTDDNDMAVRPIFSDAVSATAIELDKSNLQSSYFNLETFGEGQKAIYTEAIGDKYRMRLNGIDVYNYALTYVPNNIQKLIKNHSINLDDIDYYIFHQANKVINNSIAKKLNLSSEKVPSTLYDFGNTSSASIPITLNQSLLKQEKQKFNIILSGFGVGFSVASAFIHLDSTSLSEPYFIDL